MPSSKPAKTGLTSAESQVPNFYQFKVRLLEEQGATTSDAQAVVDAEFAIPENRPEDPDNQNDSRAEWAAAAVLKFMSETGTDPEDAFSDMLGDLMHLADRCGIDFANEMRRAENFYNQEAIPRKSISDTPKAG